jgi:hypothetical protein
MYDESKHLQAEGNAVAVSGGGGSVTTLQWLPAGSNTVFSEVPAGKTLTITDVVLNPQLDVRARHWLNLAEKTPNGGTRIFLQLRVRRRRTQQAHFLTGYVIEAGKEVVTFTESTPHAGQHITVSLNGYLPK